MIKIEHEQIGIILNKDTEKLASELNIAIEEESFANFRFMPYNEKYDKKDWETFLLVHNDLQKIIGTCGLRNFFIEEGVLEVSYDFITTFRDWEMENEIIKILKENVVVTTEIEEVIIHGIKSKKFDPENTYLDWEYYS